MPRTIEEIVDFMEAQKDTYKKIKRSTPVRGLGRLEGAIFALEAMLEFIKEGEEENETKT